MHPDDDKLIRLPEVMRLVGLCRSSIYRLEAAGLFPQRRKIGPRAVAWLLREVLEWIGRRPLVRKTSQNPDALRGVPNS